MDQDKLRTIYYVVFLVVVAMIYYGFCKRIDRRYNNRWPMYLENVGIEHKPHKCKGCQDKEKTDV